MTYTHYCRQRQSVTDIQWQTLIMEVSRVFRLTQKVQSRNSDNPIIICDGWGKQVINQPDELFITDTTGNQAILFNGDASKNQEHETFILTRKLSDDSSWFCKTARKPYDWLVTAVLILANNLCPYCYDITSDGGLTEWLPVIQWLNHHSDTEYVLPISVYSNILKNR